MRRGSDSTFGSGGRRRRRRSSLPEPRRPRIMPLTIHSALARRRGDWAGAYVSTSLCALCTASPVGDAEPGGLSSVS